MILGLVVVGLIAVQAQAVDTYWQGTTGDWFDPANWSAGVPHDELDAYIRNGGTAQIGHGNAYTYYTYIGIDPFSLDGVDGSGSLLQTGGNLTAVQVYLSGPLESPGNYTLKRGRLSAAQLLIGQDLGSGEFVQTGGISNITWQVTVGDNKWSSGQWGWGDLGRQKCTAIWWRAAELISREPAQLRECQHICRSGLTDHLRRGLRSANPVPALQLQGPGACCR